MIYILNGPDYQYMGPMLEIHTFHSWETCERHSNSELIFYFLGNPAKGVETQDRACINIEKQPAQIGRKPIQGEKKPAQKEINPIQVEKVMYRMIETNLN